MYITNALRGFILGFCIAAGFWLGLFLFFRFIQLFL